MFTYKLEGVCTSEVVDLSGGKEVVGYKEVIGDKEVAVSEEAIGDVGLFGDVYLFEATVVTMTMTAVISINQIAKTA